MLKRHWLSGLFAACITLSWSVGASPTASIANLKMPESKVSLVGENIIVNGVPMSIYKFMSNERPEDVKAFYKSRLGSKVAEQRGPQHTTLGAFQDNRYVTVRYETSSTQSTQGTISVADLSKAGEPPSMPSGTQPLPGSKLIFSTVSTDDGRTSRLFAFVNRRRVHENASTMKAQFGRAGYQLEKAKAAAAPKKGEVMLFTKGGDELIVTLTELQGATSMIFNFTSQRSSR